MQQNKKKSINIFTCILLFSGNSDIIIPTNIETACLRVVFNIRHKHFWTLSVPHAQIISPPWILKWVGLKSSDQRLISLIGKTKEVAFF